MIVVPQVLADGLIQVCGDAGRRWIQSLPDRVEHLCSEWGLQLEEQPPCGDWNLILFVRRDREPCVLKVFGPEPRTADEVKALTTWAGRGAVLPLNVDSDNQGVLLERLDPTRSLTGVELMSAAEMAGSLIRQLTVPAPPGLPLLVDIAQNHVDTLRSRQQAQGNPLPARWIDLATQLARELTTDAGTSLVHGDLHYGNVLAGTRQPWLAIDPKPGTGNPERSVPELMWDRIDDAADAAAVHGLFAALVSCSDLDPHRAWAWTVVQTVNYWLWGLNAGLTGDPVRCHRLLDTLT